MKPPRGRETTMESTTPSATQKMLACLSYGTVSVSITLFNKAVFSLYGFHYPNFVTTLQILVSILYMHLLRGVGAFQFAPLTYRGARQASMTAAGLSEQGVSRLKISNVLADLATCVLLVVVCCVWSDCFAIPDCPYV